MMVATPATMPTISLTVPSPKVAAVPAIPAMLTLSIIRTNLAVSKLRLLPKIW